MIASLLLYSALSAVGSINIENTTVVGRVFGSHDMYLPALISTFRHKPLFSTRANVKKSTPSFSSKAIPDFDEGPNFVKKLPPIKKRDGIYVTASSFARHNKLDLFTFPLIYGLKGSVANKIPFEGNQTFTHIKRPHADSGGIDHIKVNMGGSNGGLSLIDYLKFDNEVGELIPKFGIGLKSHLWFFYNYPRLKLQGINAPRLFKGFSRQPQRGGKKNSSYPSRHVHPVCINRHPLGDLGHSLCRSIHSYLGDKIQYLPLFSILIAFFGVFVGLEISERRKVWGYVFASVFVGIGFMLKLAY